jgi:DDE superfamily endonuclease
MAVATPSTDLGGPAMTSWPLPQELSSWVLLLASVLDARYHQRLSALVPGVLLARGRRTVTAWLRAAGVAAGFRAYYRLLPGLARRADELARLVLLRVALPVVAARGGRLLFGLDDTPTGRYGPRVEGAGLHHNPTPGPAGRRLVYGHVWVTLALLARHRRWGAIALPLLARLYVRRKDGAKLPAGCGWAFKTKLELAAELVGWLARWLRWTGRQLWLACDGAYAKRPLLRAARAAGVVVVSRLRRDAALRTLPAPRRPGRRGRPAVYGPDRVSLAKRAGQGRGWQRLEVELYGERAEKAYKTFVATWRPAGGAIRVVLVRERDGWRAFFCTDPAAAVADILVAVADRFSLEQAFKDLKEVWGAGQQQLRGLLANAGAYHLNLWLHALTEAWAWGRRASQLVDRSASPWDDPARRPSHADRRRAAQRACLKAEYRAATGGSGRGRKISRLARRLLRMVA